MPYINVQHALKSRLLALSYTVKVEFFVPVLFFQYNHGMTFGKKYAKIMDQSSYSKAIKYFYF